MKRFFIVAILFLAACNKGGGSGVVSTKNENQAESSRLKGTWELTHIKNGDKVAPAAGPRYQYYIVTHNYLMIHELDINDVILHKKAVSFKIENGFEIIYENSTEPIELSSLTEDKMVWNVISEDNDQKTQVQWIFKKIKPGDAAHEKPQPMQSIIVQGFPKLENNLRPLCRIEENKFIARGHEARSKISGGNIVDQSRYYSIESEFDILNLKTELQTFKVRVKLLYSGNNDFQLNSDANCTMAALRKDSIIQASFACVDINNGKKLEAEVNCVFR